MVSLRLSPIGRRAAVVASVVAIASVVACSDDTTAPSARGPVAAIPTTGPQTMILPARSLVTVRIKNIYGSLIPETAPVKFFAAGDSGVIWDNSASDKDMTVGIITASLPWSATFKACLYMDTKSYAIDATANNCNTVGGNAPTVDAGSLVMRQFPIVGFYLQDTNGNIVTGAKITLTAPPSDGFQATAQDGGAGDQPVLLDGTIVFKGNRPGTYTWCETIAPTGYLLPSPSCGTVDLYWDLGTGSIIKHQKKLIIIKPF